MGSFPIIHKYISVGSNYQLYTLKITIQILNRKFRFERLFLKVSETGNKRVHFTLSLSFHPKKTFYADLPFTFFFARSMRKAA